MDTTGQTRMVKCFEFERQCVLKDCEVRNYIYLIRQKHDAPDRVAGFSVLDVELAGVG